NQLVDSNVKPDIISRVSNASRRKIKDDVIVLVITAKIVKKTTTSSITGVNNKQPIVENIKGCAIKRPLRPDTFFTPIRKKMKKELDGDESEQESFEFDK
ncbi:hypothetical protein INT48_006889, partial [Thamnidium elegans]